MPAPVLRHRMHSMRPFLLHAPRRGFSSSLMRKNALPNYYEVMGLSPTATASQIKDRFYELSKKYHPDTIGDDSQTENFHRLKEAYAILGKPQERRKYDQGGPASARPKTPEEIRRANARREARADTKSYQNGTLEYGFSPRSSWPLEFQKFFDDYVKEMKEKGFDITKTSVSGEGFRADPQTLESMFQSKIMSRYLKDSFTKGRVPFSGMSPMQNKSANTWMRNRMAAFERDMNRAHSRATGSVYERGGAVRTGRSRSNESGHHAGSSRYTGGHPTGELGARRPSYSSLNSRSATGGTGKSYSDAFGTQSANRGFEGYTAAGARSTASRLGGTGTGEETFNSPWDAPPRRGFQAEVPRPWWMRDESASGKEHTYDTWTPGESASASKRDYSKGHVLDPRYEEDKLRMIRDEGRLKWATYGLVALLTGVAGVKALGG